MLIHTTNNQSIELNSTDDWSIHSEKANQPRMSDVIITINSEDYVVATCYYTYAMLVQSTLANFICSNVQNINMDDIVAGVKMARRYR